MNRRNFLKKSLIAAGLIAVPAVVAEKIIARPVDPSQEYHLDICRELYQRWENRSMRELIHALDLQQLQWLRLQNAVNKTEWKDFHKKGPIKYLKKNGQRI